MTALQCSDCYCHSVILIDGGNGNCDWVLFNGVVSMYFDIASNDGALGDHKIRKDMEGHGRGLREGLCRNSRGWTK
jgi:hypothetical protein